MIRNFQKKTVDETITKLKQKGIIVEVLNNNNSYSSLVKTSIAVNIDEKYKQAYERTRLV